MSNTNGENNGQMGTPPNGNNNSDGNNQGTPPSKTEDSSENALSNTQQSQMMEKTDGQNGSNGQENGNMPSAPNMQNGENMPSMSGQSNQIETAYYIIFGIEAFVVSIILIYLIMSGFNSKTLAETLNGAKNIIIYIILVVVITTGSTFAQICITKNISNSNTQNQVQNNMQMLGGQGKSANITYTANKEISEDSTIEDGEYSSTTSNENAIIATGDVDVNLSNVTVDKTGDSDGGDSCNFYGNNSAILAKDGANLTITNATITTEADGANGVFSYGGSATANNSSSDGITVTISDSKITTTGTGSPSIYSTADITVNDATLVAKASEGIVIEGANTVTIDNCDLTDSNTKLNGQSTTYKNIFLYQSMSGDASNGNAIFTAKNSKITTNKGDSFYITNTTATINLTNNTIINNDSTGNFLRAQKDSWGNS